MQAYPLQWPAGIERTARWRRKRSQFMTSSRKHALSNQVAVDAVHDQVRLLRGLGPRYTISNADLIITTNHQRRRVDGGFYSGDRDPQDPGAAVYFKYQGEMRCVAVDRWETVRENVYAIAKSIEAMRGLDRWGSSAMVRQAFTGFTAIPERTGGAGWRAVLGVDPDETVTIDDVKRKFRQLMKGAHPDGGGSSEAACRLQDALADAERELTR
jgi:hypothetical protein